METLIATYVGFRTSTSQINIKDKDTQVTRPMTIYPNFYIFNDVKTEKGDLVAAKMECPEAKNYENLMQWSKYRITCSEYTNKKIVRPSKVELIEEVNNGLEVIADAVKAYKGHMIDGPQFEAKILSVGPKNIVKWVKSVIDKQMEKS